MATRSTIRHLFRDQGFALVAVLSLSLIVASVLIILQLVTHKAVFITRDAKDDLRLNNALESGLVRLVSGFHTPDDPLRRVLIADGRHAPWEFDGLTIKLSAEAESGKWDLNAASPDFIERALENLKWGEISRARIVAQIRDRQLRGRRLLHAADVLEPAERLSDQGRFFERHFTVLTNQLAIDPATAPEANVQVLTGAVSERLDLDHRRAEAALSHVAPTVSERPIYTFRAQSAIENGPRGAMKAIVAFEAGQRPRILAWQRTGILGDASSGASTPKP